MNRSSTEQRSTPWAVAGVSDSISRTTGAGAFPCETVDQGSLRFGPALAQPKSVQLKDVNNDGVMDLKATFANQETGIMCSDTMATLSGTNILPGFGPVQFDAPVGFGTSPGC